MSRQRNFYGPERTFVPDDDFAISRKVMTRARQTKLGFLDELPQRSKAEGFEIFIDRAAAIDLVGSDEIAVVNDLNPGLTAKIVISALSRIRHERKTSLDKFLHNVRIGLVDVYTNYDGIDYIGAEVLDDGQSFHERETVKELLHNLGARNVSLEEKNPVLCLAEVEENSKCSENILDFVQDNLPEGISLDFFEVIVR